MTAPAARPSPIAPYRTPRGRRRLRPWIVRLALGALLLAGAAQAQTFRWTAQGDALTLDPHAQNELLTNSINGQVYEGLVRRDRALNLEPALATDWRQLNPTHWRLRLRPDVRFHDGTPFTADDVVFSVLRARDAVSPFKAFATGLGEPRRVDDLTVDFLLPAFNPVFLMHAAQIAIMSRKWSEAHDAARPQDFKNREEKFTALQANGTGPFMLVSRQADVQTVFRRNPRWWGRFDGNLQEVVFTPIKSDPTRTTALLSGSVDFVHDPAPQDVPRLRQGATKVLEGPENRILFIGMDQGRDELLYSNVKGRNPFKDLRVRRALYQSIDIDSLHTHLMRGQSRPTGNIMHSPLGTYNDPEFERRLPFDPERARALLAEAGYPQGFEVQLDCPNNRYIHDEEICVALSAMWARVGVRVKVNAMPRALFFPKTEKLDTSLYLFGWGGAITDAETTLTPVLRSRGEGGAGFYNIGNYRNPRLDELAIASSRESDAARREQLIKAAFREHAEQIHHIPLHRQVIPWAMRTGVDAVHRADNWLEWRWISVR